MPDPTIQPLAQMLGNFTLAIVLLYAWSQERKERLAMQERYEIARDKLEADHLAERRAMWSETLDYLRDRDGIPKRPPAPPPDLSKVA
jgi:hypothetical protein